MKALIPAALILGAISPYGECSDVIVSLASKHVALKEAPQGTKYYPFNEANAGLGYVSAKGYVIGAYYNSLRKPTVYGGYSMKCSVLDCSIVVASGYDMITKSLGFPRALQHTLPMAIIGYDVVTVKGTSITLNYVFQPDVIQVFGLSIKYKL